jgi:hypothetical protein
VAAVEVIILFSIMSSRIPKLFDAVFIHAIGRMLSATGFMALVTYVAVRLFPLTINDQSFLATFPKFVIIVLLSGVAYVAVCNMMRLEEAGHVIRRSRKLIFGTSSYRSRSNTSQ